MEDLQRYNTLYPRQEVIDHNYWDTVTYVSGSSLRLTFFTAAPKASLDLTNLETPSQLPNPKAFFVRSLGFAVKQQPRSTARAADGSVNPGALDNIAQLINTGVFRLTVGAKIYAEYPLWMLTSAGGPWGVTGADGNTADPGRLVDWANNGVPDVTNNFTLLHPLFIAPQINFSGEITWPAAITLSGSDTPIVLNMGGDLIRPVQ